MEPVSDPKPNEKLKHSKAGIIGFILLLSVSLPIAYLTLHGKIFPPGYLSGVLSLNQTRYAFDFLMIWMVGAPLIAFIISVIDVKKPNRLKVLPKITLILDSIIIAAVLIALVVTAVSDISRMLNG